MWTLNDVRIFVQEHTGEGGYIIPRLQPLSGETILQFFGYESEVRQVNAYIVGEADRNTLMAMRKNPISYDLVSPMGWLGKYYINKISFKQIPNICQTLRPDLDEDAPMFIVDLELYPEDD